MKKIKVLFIINSLAGGGAERVLVHILENLDRNKFGISLCTFFPQVDYNVPSDIKYFSFNKRNYLDLVSIIYKLKNIFQSGKYDVIVSFLTYTNIFVTISWLLSGKKIPLVISEHCNPIDNLKNQRFSRIKLKLISKLYPFANVVIAVSEGVKNSLSSCFKIPTTKLKVIYNPINIKKIDTLKREKITEEPVFKNDNKPIIISCGRLTKQKNYSLLIKAMKILKDAGIKANLIILGKGEEEKRLKKLVKDLNLEKEVKFLGFKKNPYKYISKATIFVLSSKYEGFPNVLLEAMACGTPVISTNCPYGPSEIIEHGKNGFLVPVDDEYSLAEKIKILLKEPTLRRNFAIEGRKIVERKFDLKKIIKQWEDLIIYTVEAMRCLK
ncbi:MAG: glycosyltransferase [Nautiliaceae bacterium]